jgi:hypothetical protein
LRGQGPTLVCAIEAAFRRTRQPADSALTVRGRGRIVGGDGRHLGRREPVVNVLDVAKLALIVATPTLLGALAVCGPRWCGVIADRWRARHPEPPQPAGPPIEQLAADLRRLLRLHGELTVSAHLAMRAHRLWAVEAAIGDRAVEAARALDVPHRAPTLPGALRRDELVALLQSLSAAGLVLPAKVGPFTIDGRI